MSLIEIYDILVVINQNTPEKFEEFRDRLLAKEIERMCYGDESCVWKAKGIVRKHRLKYAHLKDPIARCNASMADMWTTFEEFNETLRPFRTPK